MPRRPASITQADVARIIRAAKQAGAAEVVVHVNGEPVVIRLQSTMTEAPLAPEREIVL
jgi:hypothetical protein